MNRQAAAVVAIVSVAWAALAKTHEAPVDPAKGAKLASRIPCDGQTNPEDNVVLKPTFSGGGVERAFRIELFEKEYCKHGDLGFKCIQSGHDRWKQEWSVDSVNPRTGFFGLSACSEWGSKDSADYVLTGWYRDSSPGAGGKRGNKEGGWNQAEIKRVSNSGEIYEFADPMGGMARLEIVRQ